MAKNNSSFRASLFGGLNKEDVEEYIKTLENEIESIKVLHQREKNELMRRMEAQREGAEDGQVPKLQEELRLSEERAQELTRQLEEKERDAERLRRALEEKERDAERLRRALAEKPEGDGRLEAELQKARQELEQYRLKFGQGKAKARQVQEELQHKENRARMLSQQLEEKEQENQRLRRALAARGDQGAPSKEELERRGQELEQLRRTLEAKGEQEARLRQELEQARQELARRNEDALAKEDEASRYLALEKENEALRREKAEAEKKLEAALRPDQGAEGCQAAGKVLEDARQTARMMEEEARKRSGEILESANRKAKKQKEIMKMRITMELADKGIQLIAAKHEIDQYAKQIKRAQEGLNDIYASMSQMAGSMPVGLADFWKDDLYGEAEDQEQTDLSMWSSGGAPEE